MRKLPFIFWLNKVLAHPLFIILINLVFVVLKVMHTNEGSLDLSMSWVTMAMDQIIISAGWVALAQQWKARKEDHAIIVKLTRQLDLLIKGK